MDLKPKKLCFPSYNLLTDITALPSEAIFILIDEFVDACDIPYWVLLLNGLPLGDLSHVLVRSTLNFCTHQFIVDFVITFCTPYNRNISREFHYPKHLLALKTK